ncbi:MAG TPA: hydrogenase maturation protease [Streptosporangiaceae bacterium]
MTSNPQVIGMGNILFRDEGVGVYAAHYLRAAYRFTPAIEIADGATMGFGLMNYFQLAGPPARLLILDALLADDQPGAVYLLANDQLTSIGPTMRPTAHEVDPIQLLKLATAFGRPPEMSLLGIVPADTSELAVGLTPELSAAFTRYVDAAIAELGACGVRAEQVRSVSLDDVIGELVTCQP